MNCGVYPTIVLDSLLVHNLSAILIYIRSGYQNDHSYLVLVNKLTLPSITILLPRARPFLRLQLRINMVDSGRLLGMNCSPIERRANDLATAVQLKSNSEQAHFAIQFALLRNVRRHAELVTDEMICFGYCSITRE